MHQHAKPNWMGMRGWCVLLLVSMLAGCGGSGYATKGIEGLLPDLDFDLTGESGRVLSEEDFLGAPVVVFFGFTHCPDVCPTAMARIAGAIEAGGDAIAPDIRVLFVSVDPGRDDPADLARYTDFFSERVTGATAPVSVLRDLTKRYRATFGYDSPNEFGDYNVSHSSAMYVFDAEGQARALFRPDDSVAAMAQDLRTISR